MMWDIADSRLGTVSGPDGTAIDLRPVLQSIISSPHDKRFWRQLGRCLRTLEQPCTAGYAAVCGLAWIGQRVESLPPELFSMVTQIELARLQTRGSDLPGWLREDYTASLESLARSALKRLADPCSPAMCRSLISIVLLWKGAGCYAIAIHEFTEAELAEFFLIQDVG